MPSTKTRLPSELNCSLCAREVLVSGLVFGQLENCAHPFCSDCILRWRHQGRLTRTATSEDCCPVCEVASERLWCSSTWTKEAAAKTRQLDALEAIEEIRSIDRSHTLWSLSAFLVCLYIGASILVVSIVYRECCTAPK